MIFHRALKSQFETLLLTLLSLVLWTNVASARLIDYAKESAKTGGHFSDPLKMFVLSIRPGDVIQFSNGKTYTITERLGMGYQHCVFAIAENPGLVLRLVYRDRFRDSTIKTLEGYETLKRTKIRTVRIDPESNYEYVLAERLANDRISLFEFIFGLDAKGHPIWNDLLDLGTIPFSSIRAKQILKRTALLAADELREMDQALIRFVTDLGDLRSIADLNDTQIFYDRHQKEWILVDWLRTIEAYNPLKVVLKNSRHLVSSLLSISNNVNMSFIPTNPFTRAQRDRISYYDLRLYQALEASRHNLKNPYLCHMIFR